LEASTRAGINAIGVLSGYDSLKQLSEFDFVIKDDALQAVRLIEKEL
jgi:hypothetical protein